MKIAIHDRPGSFSDKWIQYCEENDISYKLVNCYESNIMSIIEDCDGLMWHWLHYDYKAVNFARQLTYSLESVGKKMFPDSKTCWHFDDKVGQKYLLEAFKAPLVNAFVFYEKAEALQWAKNTIYPKVFKLRGGAGSLNVKLVKNKAHACSLIRKAFGKGFSTTDNSEKVRDRWGKFKKHRDKSSLWALIRGLALYFLPSLSVDLRHRAFDKGYIYFQEFIPGNDHDIRVVVIGERAFAIKRMVRDGDFKASGSGLIKYERDEIPEDCVKLSFLLSKKLQTQCLAYDFVFDSGITKVVEISYGFSRVGYLPCPGYWDSGLNWHEEKFTPEWFMVEDFIRKLKTSDSPS